MGLMGTMGMNVLERTREIGIMRSIGAVDGEIMRTVIVEGMVIGGISWLIGALLSFPITYLLSDIVSLAIFQSPIAVHFTLPGVWHLAAGSAGALGSGQHPAGPQCRPVDHPGSAGIRVVGRY